MNKVITKLNEIEEKANSIIEDAKAEKARMEERLLLEKKEIDTRLFEEEKKRAAVFSRELEEKAEAELMRLGENNKTAIAGLQENFEKNAEQMAEEIFRKIIG